MDAVGRRLEYLGKLGGGAHLVGDCGVPLDPAAEYSRRARISVVRTTQHNTSYSVEHIAN